MQHLSLAFLRRGCVSLHRHQCFLIIVGIEGCAEGRVAIGFAKSTEKNPKTTLKIMSTELNILVGLVYHDDNGDAVNVQKPLFHPFDIHVTTFRDLATFIRKKYPGFLPEEDYLIFLKTKDVDGDVTASQDRTLGTFVLDAFFGDTRPCVDFVIPAVELPKPPPLPPQLLIQPPRLTETPVSVDTTTSSSSSLSREVLPNNHNHIITTTTKTIISNNNDHNDSHHHSSSSSSSSSINSDAYIIADQPPSYGLISASAQQRQSSMSNVIAEQSTETSSIPFNATYPTMKKPPLERRSTPMGHLLQLFLEQDDGTPYTKYPFHTLSDLGIYFKCRHNKAWKDMKTGNTLTHFLQSNPDYFRLSGVHGGQGIVHLVGEHGSYELIGERSDNMGYPKGSSEDLRETVTARSNIIPISSIRPAESRVVVVDSTTTHNSTVAHSYTTNNHNNNTTINNNSINSAVPSKGVGRVVNLGHHKVDDDRRRERSRSRDNNDRGRERDTDSDRGRDRDYNSSSSSSSSSSRSYRGGSSNSPSRGSDNTRRGNDVSYRTNHPYGRASPVGRRVSSSSSSSSSSPVPCRHFSQGNYKNG